MNNLYRIVCKTNNLVTRQKWIAKDYSQSPKTIQQIYPYMKKENKIKSALCKGVNTRKTRRAAPKTAYRSAWNLPQDKGRSSCHILDIPVSPRQARNPPQEGRGSLFTPHSGHPSQSKTCAMATLSGLKIQSSEQELEAEGKAVSSFLVWYQQNSLLVSSVVQTE